jgi:hypothetical protein
MCQPDEREPDFAQYGYVRWAWDFTGRSWLSPDGGTVVTKEQAIREITGAADDDEGPEAAA